MYWVYVLKGTSFPRYYIGYTTDTKRRLAEHNAGKNYSTKHGRPWDMLYCEGFQHKDGAIRREKNLKRKARAWQELIKRVDPEYEQ